MVQWHTPIDLVRNELRNFVIQNLAAAPASPVRGVVYYDNTLETYRGWNGTAWIDLGSTGVTDHGALTGLGDDDHPQYLNEARGDARYVNEVDHTKAAHDALNINADTVDGSHAADLLARGNHTGTQTAATISDFDTQVRTSRLDQMAVPTVALSLNGQKITGLADGTATTDAATFGQLNAITEAKTWKDPVRVATTANIALSGDQTIDGVATVAGDRVLVKNQTAASENGIYVTAGGTTAWTRAADANTADEISNATVLVTEGTVAQGDVFTANDIATLGTDAITFTKTGEGNTTYTADGTTLVLTGSEFSVATGGITATQLAASVAGDGLTGGGGTALTINAGAGLEVAADAVRIAAGAAGNGLTGGGGSALAVGAGTGIVVAADSVAIDTSIVTRKASGTIGDGTATSIAFTHNLGTRDVSVQIYDTATYETVFCGVVRNTTNQVTLNFGSAPALNAFRVVVTG